MSHGILIGMYVVGALCEIAGIIVEARDIVIHDTGQGVIQFKAPKGWEAARGPGLIIFGILLGPAANILWLCSP